MTGTERGDIGSPAIEARSARPDTTLVGRETELAAARAAVAIPEGDSTRVLAVSGEPGIGKSRLVAALVADAEERGALVLEGRAAEFERELPFGVLIEALDEYLRSLSPSGFSRVVGDAPGELAAVFPALRDAASGEAGGAAEDRALAHHAVRGLLERLALTQPLVLVLEDAHWADPSSVEVISHLLRRPPRAQVGIVLTFRTGREDIALAASLAGAEASAIASRIELGPLGTAASDELLGGVDPARREWVRRESGGNPFYLLQLARSSEQSEPGAATELLGAASVPAAVAATIRAELAALPGPARRLAESAAVAGDPFDLDLAATAAGVAESEALDQIDELTARELVRGSAVPRRFDFRHPIVRSAVYEAATPGTRLGLHARAAEELTARGADAAAIAHHAEHAARPGDETALGVLLEAAGAAAARAPASAARWYGAAARILEPSDDRRGAVLVAQATALGAIGRLDEAEAAIGDALAHDDGTDPARRAELTIALARVEQGLGRVEGARRRLRAALEELGDTDPGVAASIWLAIAQAELLAADYPAMTAAARRADELAGGASDAPRRAAGRALLALAAALNGEVAEAERVAEETATLVDALPDEEISRELRALTDLAAAELYIDRFPATVSHGTRALELARASGQGALIPTLYPALGTGLWVVGRVRESVELLRGAVDGARLIQNPQLLPWALFNLALAAVIAGDFELAGAAGEESVERAGELEEGFVTAYAQAVLAAIEIERGDPERGIDRLLREAGGISVSKIGGGWGNFFAEVMTRGLIGLGRVEEAEAVTAAARERADAIGLPHSDSLAAACEALVAHERGRYEEAVERAGASVELAASCGAAADVDFNRQILARSLAAAGHRDEAIAEFRQTASSFEAGGARRFRDQVESELRGLGERTYRRTARDADADGVAALTGRELEIARLVVDRMTNAEIAAELYLGVKTIETHMRNIFRKLDVSSRVEVARVVEAAERRD